MYVSFGVLLYRCLGCPGVFFKQKTAYEMRISDWSSDVCSSDLPFHRILLDAPCSGTGVIRRHPDIKWLRRETDITGLQGQQLRLLKSAWRLLKPGGRLLYATCSMLRSEGDDTVQRFLAEHENVEDRKSTRLNTSH